jgi:hypothetical protein
MVVDRSEDVLGERRREREGGVVVVHEVLPKRIVDSG